MTILKIRRKRLVKGLVVEEAVEQGQGGSGLVHGHHVAGLIHLQEGKAASSAGGLRGAGSSSSHGGVGGGGVSGVVPGVVGLGVEAVVARPGQSLRPGLVADPATKYNKDVVVSDSNDCKHLR